MGVTEGAVSQWMKRAAEGGEDALAHQLPAGATPQLTDAQRNQLPELLAKGAQAYGFLGDVWTQRRVQQVIQQTFGVTYHRDYVRPGGFADNPAGL